MHRCAPLESRKKTANERLEASAPPAPAAPVLAPFRDGIATVAHALMVGASSDEEGRHFGEPKGVDARRGLFPRKG